MLLGSQMTVDEGDFPPSLVTNQQIQTLDTPIAYPKSTIPNLVNQDQTTFEKRANLAERHCLKQFLVKQRRIKIKLEQQDRLTGATSLSCHKRKDSNPRLLFRKSRSLPPCRPTHDSKISVLGGKEVNFYYIDVVVNGSVSAHVEVRKVQERKLDFRPERLIN